MLNPVFQGRHIISLSSGSGKEGTRSSSGSVSASPLHARQFNTPGSITKYGRNKSSQDSSPSQPPSPIRLKVFTRSTTGAPSERQERTAILARQASIRTTLIQTKSLMTETNSPLLASNSKKERKKNMGRTQSYNVTKLNESNAPITTSGSLSSLDSIMEAPAKTKKKKGNNTDPFHLERKNRQLQKENIEYRNRQQQSQEDLEKAKAQIEELQKQVEILVVELDRRPTVTEVTEYTAQVTYELVDLKQERFKLIKERDNAKFHVQELKREKKLMEEEIQFVQEELDLTVDEVKLQKECAQEKESQLLKRLEEKNKEIHKLQQQHHSPDTLNKNTPSQEIEQKLALLTTENERLSTETQKLSTEKLYFEEKCGVMAIHLKRLCDALEESDMLHEQLLATNEENEKLRQILVELELDFASLQEDNAVLAADNNELVEKLAEFGLKTSIKENKLTFLQENLEGLSIDELLDG